MLLIDSVRDERRHSIDEAAIISCARYHLRAASLSDEAARYKVSYRMSY